MALPSISNVGLNLYPPAYQESLTKLARIHEINPLINDLNQAILSYNTLDNFPEKRDALAAIEKKIDTLNDLDNATLSTYTTYFEDVHVNLFRAIQEEKEVQKEAFTTREALTLNYTAPQTSKTPLTFAKLIAQFFKFFTTKETPIKLPVEEVTLTELIAQMDPTKINELQDKLLFPHRNNSLASLYKAGEAEKEVFDLFSKNHTIQVLGGGNSKNFKITNKKTGTIQVLKLENRLSSIRKPETHLRAKTTGILSPVHVSRRAISSTNQGSVVRNMQVVDYYPSNDVEEYGKKHKNSKDKDKLDTAASIFSAMARHLIQIQEAGCAFIDMKNTNWLVVPPDQLTITDTKGFILTDTQGNFPSNERGVHSPHMITSELTSTTPVSCSADKLHACLLCRNLYQHLTGSNSDYLFKRDRHGRGVPILDASELDFSNPIFKTPKGSEYKKLILDTVKFDQNDRLSLKQVQERIQEISNTPQSRKESSTVVKSRSLADNTSQAIPTSPMSNTTAPTQDAEQKKEPEQDQEQTPSPGP